MQKCSVTALPSEPEVPGGAAPRVVSQWTYPRRLAADPKRAWHSMGSDLNASPVSDSREVDTLQACVRPPQRPPPRVDSEVAMQPSWGNAQGTHIDAEASCRSYPHLCSNCTALYGILHKRFQNVRSDSNSFQIEMKHGRIVFTARKLNNILTGVLENVIWRRNMLQKMDAKFRARAEIEFEPHVLVSVVGRWQPNTEVKLLRAELVLRWGTMFKSLIFTGGRDSNPVLWANPLCWLCS